MELALQINDLCKSYEKSDFRLQNINIEISKGSIMGFVGRNGSGKSTTISTMLNIIKKDSGTIKFFGHDMVDENLDIRNYIGVVFDCIHFYGDLTPHKLEKVLSDIYSNWDNSMFFKLLSRFEVHYNKKINTFSRGTQMKLSISVALSHSANLLILDEPTAGLDPIAREEILDVLLEFVEDENNSILISSHISSDLEKVADYITFIDNGKIILTENKDVLIYEYGIAKLKQIDFDNLDKSEYIAYRTRGTQVEVLIHNKKKFIHNYPHIVVDNATIDDILQSIARERC